MDYTYKSALFKVCANSGFAKAILATLYFYNYQY